MNFKKYLPFIVVGVIAIVFIAGVLIIRRNNNNSSDSNQDQNQTEAVPDLPADQKPATSLIPKSDGHWLKLKVEGIKVANVSSMDYELIYKANNTGTPVTQGVPGTVQLNGQTSIDRDLLLGSESSGKFRYDMGVDNGTLTLRFRDSNGKLLGKLSTDWHLQTNTTVLTSVDGSFKYTLDRPAIGVWFVVMQSFAKPGWTIYSSDGLTHSGK